MFVFTRRYTYTSPERSLFLTVSVTVPNANDGRYDLAASIGSAGRYQCANGRGVRPSDRIKPWPNAIFSRDTIYGFPRENNRFAERAAQTARVVPPRDLLRAYVGARTRMLGKHGEWKKYPFEHHDIILIYRGVFYGVFPFDSAVSGRRIAAGQKRES